jgi:hypothetical protein
MLPTSAPAAPVALTDRDLQALASARAWARFMAIVGFIGCGLFGLIMVLALAATMVKRSYGPTFALGAGTLVGVGFGIAYFALLLRYASGVAAHARGDTAGLARAFWGLKVLWIITVISYCFSIVMTVVMTAGQLLGFTPPGQLH